MNLNKNLNHQGKNFKVKHSAATIILLCIFTSAFLLESVNCSSDNRASKSERDSTLAEIAEMFTEEKLWTAPDIATIPNNDEGKLIKYGLNLVVHTSKYFGPKGSVSSNGNGLNCQNCHMEAGTRPYGNNLGAASTIYPKYLPRSGTVVSLAEKINECFYRSLNGDIIDTTSKEMRALVAYTTWLGKDFHKDPKLKGSRGIDAPHFIDRAADPAKGEKTYDELCARCHGKDGQGQFTEDVLKDITKQQGGIATADDLYYYPPLWGDKSYNAIATLYRVGKLAGFIKHNMPYPLTYKNSVLTDEQAWDIAAYINSRERPEKDHSKDYSIDISKKPYDFPFAPYADSYSQQQHKFGPFTDMPSAMKAH